MQYNEQTLKILRQISAELMNYYIDVNTNYGYIDIRKDNKSCLFLQGDDASNVISTAWAYWNGFGTITENESYELALASLGYIDLIDDIN